MVDAVLSTLEVHPEIIQTNDNLKYGTSLYTSQPANKRDRTIESHFSITSLCEY